VNPRAGERVLELGPGLGQEAVEVARCVAPDGRLDVLDVQQEMLDATMQRARDRGVDNITPTLGDASGDLPYGDGLFDAAYMTGVFGEIPDKPRVLSELRRVLKPGGRLVVGEAALDPDFVSLGRLRALVEEAGLRFERRLGPPFVFYARFLKD
jgi:ubiquinone/menaquinone biosynthesis C-methylase UbiE